MISIDIRLDGDGAIPEMAGKRIYKPAGGLIFTGLERGMQSGRPSVAIAFPVGQEGDSWVFAETSLRLFLTAADALKARYGDPR